MEERKESKFVIFNKRSVLIVTKSGFKYHTASLDVDSDSVSFIDNRGDPIYILNEEIKFIQAQNGN